VHLICETEMRFKFGDDVTVFCLHWFTSFSIKRSFDLPSECAASFAVNLNWDLLIKLPQRPADVFSRLLVSALGWLAVSKRIRPVQIE